MKRGDIVYIRNESCKTTGHEQAKNRPAIVVSNEACNLFSPVIEVVYVTHSPKKKLLPTHVIIQSTPSPSVALCEAVYSVDVSRIERIIGSCSLGEILQINHALAVSLGLV